MSLGRGGEGGGGGGGFAGTTVNHHLLLAYVAWTTGDLLRFNVTSHRILVLFSTGCGNSFL